MQEENITEIEASQEKKSYNTSLSVEELEILSKEESKKEKSGERSNKERSKDGLGIGGRF